MRRSTSSSPNWPRISQLSPRFSEWFRPPETSSSSRRARCRLRPAVTDGFANVFLVFVVVRCVCSARVTSARLVVCLPLHVVSVGERLGHVFQTHSAVDGGSRQTVLLAKKRLCVAHHRDIVVGFAAVCTACDCSPLSRSSTCPMRVTTSECHGCLRAACASHPIVMHLLRGSAGRLNRQMRSECWAACSEGNTETTEQAFTLQGELVNSASLQSALQESPTLQH